VGAVRAVAPGRAGLCGSLDGFAAHLECARPDEVVLAEAHFDEQTVLDVVQLAHRHGVKVKLAPTTTELLVHEGEYVPGQGIPLFELRPPMLTGVDWATKRAFDLVVSILFLVLGIPLWLLIAAAIKLDSRGPVLYVSRRVGVREQEFGMLKFRTMVSGAAEQQDALEEENEASGALFKIRDDPRVTRVGRVLRRLSLDELPQLVNVLRGEMSLVGPRPLPLRDHAMLQDWHRARSLVLPGMTGLWQISGRSGLEFDDLVRLDFTYIENWSIWSDVSIIARTIPAVLGGRGAY
jgi:exopolysaccharide biosynthesis polyprenyl glycosylphosphotransferase